MNYSDVKPNGSFASGECSAAAQTTSRVYPDPAKSANHSIPAKSLAPSSPLLLSSDELSRLVIHSSAQINLRRDLHHFVKYTEQHEIKRSYRENEIPKSDEQRLAKIMSLKRPEGQGFGDYFSWSDYVSYCACRLRLVSFDTLGEYRGEFSQSRTFPDNYIKHNKNAWNAFLEKSALERERELLEALLSMTKNEFFALPTLLACEKFSSRGSACGPASKMNLQKIRRVLLNILINFEPNVWYDAASAIELIRKLVPALILDPNTREPNADSLREQSQWSYSQKWGKANKPNMPKPAVVLEDIYSNFAEYERKDEYEYKGRQIISAMPDGFERVEGRYFEYFLREIPFILSYLDLAFRPAENKTGMEVKPAFGRLRGFRLSPRFFAVCGQKNAAVNTVKTTVLPNFELVIEAISHPDKLLDTLSNYTSVVREEPPIYRLKLDRKKVVETTAAAEPNAKRIQDLLIEASAASLPSNVASELASWTSMAEKIVFYEDGSLLEMRDGGSMKQELLKDIDAKYVLDDRLTNFIIVKNAATVLDCLEKKHYVPVSIRHQKNRLIASDGALAPIKSEKSRYGNSSAGKAAKKQEPESVTALPQDVVCFRVTHKAFLSAVKKELEDQVDVSAVFLISGELLVLSAGELPKWRTALRKLAGRFNVGN